MESRIIVAYGLIAVLAVAAGVAAWMIWYHSDRQRMLRSRRQVRQQNLRQRVSRYENELPRK